MRKILIALIFCITLPFATPLFAQTPTQAAQAEQPSALPIQIPTPDAWEEKSLTPDDYRYKAYVNPQTESSIEILRKKLDHVELANTLFSSFDKQLSGVSFTKNSAASAEKTFDLADATQLSGTWNEYTYVNRDISIHTITFAFTFQDHAFIIVGYFSPAEREAGIDVLKNLIQSITIQPS